MDAEQYREALARCGGVQEEIALKARWSLLQEWRTVYAAPFHARTGRWKDGQFEWHIFSGQSTRGLNGARAEAAYAAERPSEVLAVPEEDAYAAVRIQLPHGKGRRPDFSAIYGDVYVWPPDLAWTMAFTHEQASGLGPYFSRREWATASNPHSGITRL